MKVMTVGTRTSCRPRRAPTLKAPFVTAAVVLVAILATPSRFVWNPWFNLFAIGVAFPVLVALAAAWGARLSAISRRAEALVGEVDAPAVPPGVQP